VLLLDVRSDPTSYGDGHIVGAVELPFDALRAPSPEAGVVTPDMSVDAEAFAARLRAVGLSNGRPVVLTHRGRGFEDAGYATYVYWQLKRFGHDAVALLDGGTKKWTDEGREIWGERDEAEPGDFTARDARPDLAVDTAAVRAMSEAGESLVDARPFTWYIGLEKRGDVPEGGHIPGATLLPFDAMFEGSGAFRPVERLAKVAEAVGLSPDRTVATYCNTAHVSSITWFVLSELAGYDDVRLYDGSMVAWSRHGLPVEARLR